LSVAERDPSSELTCASRLSTTSTMRNWWTCSGTTTVANRRRPGALVGDLDEFWRNHLPIERLRLAAAPVTVTGILRRLLRRTHPPLDPGGASA
jgi:hypothetical protein